MILKFEYELEKDVYNYLAIVGTKNKGGNSHVLDLLTEKHPDWLNHDDIKKWIPGYVSYNHFDIDKSLNEIGNSWEKVEAEFIKRANKIFTIDFQLEKITAYLTTADRCTYGEDYFFVTIHGHHQLKIIMHELVHLYTVCAFKEELSKLTEKQAYDVKETITELLNLEFSDLLETPDDGYQIHKELREKFRQFWTEEKDIKKAVYKFVDYVK
jgi:hypothetical protein